MNARRAVRVLTAGLLLSAGASAYYHFVRFTTTSGPYTPIFDRFDLDALPGRTVQFFITDQAPSAVAPGDSIPAIVSELRAAAKVWTDVGTSDLRLAYGGIATADTAQATPGIDVIFSDDIAPGLIALGGPTSRAVMVTNASGSFVPIQRSVLMLRRDLSTRPSWSERFFLTLVHEFGHTLGLQHTLASATMATEITRSSTKASPLGGDDIAGISILYPTSAFLASTGTISGLVTLSGAGVNLASVVALSTTGPAISTLSNPDGTYRLAGLPPGQYSVYVHALPPALAGENSPANIIAPSDPNGKIPAGSSFATQFSSGTVSVTAGKTVGDLNFAVQPRPDGDQISAVQTYSFFGSNAVKPAFFNKTAGQGSLIAAGVNLTANGGPTPGLGLQVLNGADSVDAVSGYVSDPVNWIQANITLNANAPDGPRHLLFTTPTDLYVLPAAYRVATAPPPVITGVQPSGDGGLSIAGNNIGAGTRILFDGIPAATRTASDGLLVVVPPAAPGNYRAPVVALNADGQSSLFEQGDNPSTFTFDSQSDIAGMSIAPASLPAGTDTFIEINAPGGNFAQGDTRVGFGTSDLLVRKIWVFSPTRLLAEVSVAPGAQSSTSTVTVVTGLRHFYQTYSFSVQQPNPQQVSFAIPSAAPGYGWVYPGGFASVQMRNLPPDDAISLFLGGIPVPVTSAAGNQVTFRVPPGIASGLYVLSAQVGSEFSLSSLLLLEPPPPIIGGVFAGLGVSISGLRMAHPGETLWLYVTGLGDPGSTVAKERVRVQVGGIDQTVLNVTSNLDLPGHWASFTLSPDTPTDQPQPVRVFIDSHYSDGFYILIQPAN